LFFLAIPLYDRTRSLSNGHQYTKQVSIEETKEDKIAGETDENIEVNLLYLVF
jgi:hypothetical protein